MFGQAMLNSGYTAGCKKEGWVFSSTLFLNENIVLPTTLIFFTRLHKQEDYFCIKKVDYLKLIFYLATYLGLV